MVHEDRLKSYRGNGWLRNSKIAQPFKESMAEGCPGTSGGPCGPSCVGTSTRDEALVLAMLNDLDIASLHAITLSRDWMAGDQTAAQIPWPPADLDWTTQEWRHWSAQVSPLWLICIVTWWSGPWTGYGRPEQGCSHQPPPMSC